MTCREREHRQSVTVTMGGRNVETVQMLTGDAGGEHRTLFHHAALCIIGEVLSINAKQMQSRCKTDAKQMQNGAENLPSLTGLLRSGGHS